jgi:hypothetical protein
VKRIALIAAVAAMSLPALATAQVRSIGNTHVTPIANTVMSTSDDGKICKLILRTGSRLGEQRICKSKEEWDQITQDARKATERKQIMPFKDPLSG